jgi:hypothetical protein
VRISRRLLAFLASDRLRFFKPIDPHLCPASSGAFFLLLGIPEGVCNGVFIAESAPVICKLYTTPSGKML